MTLWIVTVALLALGVVAVSLRIRFHTLEPAGPATRRAVLVIGGYVIGVGGLMVVNAFLLGRLDPGLAAAPWRSVLGTLWPGWVVFFSPLVVGGVFVTAGGVVRPATRWRLYALLLVLSLACVEMSALLAPPLLVLVGVQVVAFVAFLAAAVVLSRGRSRDAGG